MKPVFHACFRMEDDKLVLEHDVPGIVHKVAKFTMDDLYIIGGDKKLVIYMNDTPDTAAGSLISSTALLGALFDPSTRFLYFEVTDVEFIPKPEHSSVILSNANTGGELYIVCDECVREVA